MRHAIRIGLIGFGTIGTGVVRLLQRHGSAIRDRLGVKLELARIADIDTKRSRGVRLPRGVLVADARVILDDPGIDIVIELVGGTGIARRFVRHAFAGGKDVVTANKALLAHHGREIFAAAEKNGVELGFEASVGGGIPIVRTLKEGLPGDENEAVYGIVNGTCNYILTRMTAEGKEFDEVLKEAQKDGLAEADPTLDVDGIDAAHKLCLLIQLAFGQRVPLKAIPTEGIRHLTQADIAYARELGYVIKPLAVAKVKGGRIEPRVHPALLPRSHVLAQINGALNAIMVHGAALRTSTYVGLGAGMMPTGTAVMADVIEIARNRLHGSRGRVPPLGYPASRQRTAALVSLDALESEYYLRFMAVDRPGVLARIAGILGKAGISIGSVIQKEREKGVAVPIVMRTHAARERDMRRALRAIDGLSVTRGKATLIRIEENFA